MPTQHLNASKGGTVQSKLFPRNMSVCVQTSKSLNKSYHLVVFRINRNCYKSGKIDDRTKRQLLFTGRMKRVWWNKHKKNSKKQSRQLISWLF